MRRLMLIALLAASLPAAAGSKVPGKYLKDIGAEDVTAVELAEVAADNAKDAVKPKKKAAKDASSAIRAAQLNVKALEQQRKADKASKAASRAEGDNDGVHASVNAMAETTGALDKAELDLKLARMDADIADLEYKLAEAEAELRDAEWRQAQATAAANAGHEVAVADWEVATSKASLRYEKLREDLAKAQEKRAEAAGG